MTDDRSAAGLPYQLRGPEKIAGHFAGLDPLPPGPFPGRRPDPAPFPAPFPPVRVDALGGAGRRWGSP